jgi:hypothetical protein
MLNWIKREDMPEPIAKVSQSNAMDLFRRMNLDETDPGKINDLRPVRDAYIGGGLTRADEEWLEKRFAEAKTPEGDRLTQVRSQFAKNFAHMIDASNDIMGKIDTTGKQKAYDFERYVDQRVNEYRAAKKSPFDLFDPAKPDFLGKPEILDFFTSPMAQEMQKAARAMAAAQRGPSIPPPPPGYRGPSSPEVMRRQPGESLADFDKRTGIR